MAATPAYPRDLVGYGRNVPSAAWPNGTRVAVQFVINYEEGAENCVLHGDAASEAFLSEIVGAQAWPGQRHANMESIYEYGSRAGFWRLHRLFTGRGLPVTVFAVAEAMARNREAVEAMQEAGWEIASHGLKWIDYRDVPEAEERSQIARAFALHEEVTGAPPVGFYQGRTSIRTTRLAFEREELLYSADSYADDLPYFIELTPDGVPLPRPSLVVPYTLDANDMRFATPQGFNSGDQFFAYLRDSFDVLHDEGATRPAMMSIGLHCRLVGRPGRVRALERFLDHVAERGGAWVATRESIARHWIRHHAPASLTPSRMSRAPFVARFGDVFEHSPWIADAAHRAGLRPEADTAEGLHRALVGALRAGTPDQGLALIQAHPDLAGRLALAGGLTADSKREQAGAGLDALTPAELERFTAANEAYRARFGFPFVIAVAGLDKAAILEAFERRLGNDREAEVAAALREIETIALIRLRGRLPS